MRRADAALYAAKRGGRNRVERAPSPEAEPETHAQETGGSETRG